MSQAEQAEMRQRYATLCGSGTLLDKDHRLLRPKKRELLHRGGSSLRL